MVRDANGWNNLIRAKHVGCWLHGSRELQFSTCKNHYTSLIKTSLWIQKQNFSADLNLLFGIVYFLDMLRYLQLSKIIVCTLWTFLLSLAAAVVFQLCYFHKFLNTNLYLLSFSIQGFWYHKQVIFKSQMRWFSLWYFSNLPFSSGLDKSSRSQVFFTYIFFFFWTLFFLKFWNSYPTTTISCLV